MDDELFGIAKTAIGAEHELSPAQSARLRGSTAAELRADAAAMRHELGLAPLPDPRDRERDEQGRYRPRTSADDFNRLIRSVAGR